MGKVSVFNFMTLNGYFEGPNGDVSWNSHGAEESEFASESASAGNTLLFGRVTYQHMAQFWPTPQAHELMPKLAKAMNSADKIVFSRALARADWNNTSLSHDLVATVTQLKQSEKHATLLGSGSILTQLAEHGLVDEYSLMLNPVALGAGTPLLKGLVKPLKLKLVSTRTFGDGVVLLNYQL